MARKRPTASEDRQALAPRRNATGEVLTRTEVRASRSTPLTKTEFKAHRFRADQRVEPLRSVLGREIADPPGP